MGTKSDSFELYDLRVEVICPPGERILCGAKPGDHFTLEGEMINLPPGQGFSVYSLCKFRDNSQRLRLMLLRYISSGIAIVSSETAKNVVK